MAELQLIDQILAFTPLDPAALQFSYFKQVWRMQITCSYLPLLRHEEESKDEFMQDIYRTCTTRLERTNELEEDKQTPIRVWIFYTLYTLYEIQTTKRKRKIELPQVLWSLLLDSFTSFSLLPVRDPLHLLSRMISQSMFEFQADYGLREEEVGVAAEMTKKGKEKQRPVKQRKFAMPPEYVGRLHELPDLNSHIHLAQLRELSSSYSLAMEALQSVPLNSRDISAYQHANATLRNATSAATASSSSASSSSSTAAIAGISSAATSAAAPSLPSLSSSLHLSVPPPVTSRLVRRVEKNLDEFSQMGHAYALEIMQATAAANAATDAAATVATSSSTAASSATPNGFRSRKKPVKGRGAVPAVPLPSPPLPPPQPPLPQQRLLATSTHDAPFVDEKYEGALDYRALLREQMQQQQHQASESDTRMDEQKSNEPHILASPSSATSASPLSSFMLPSPMSHGFTTAATPTAAGEAQQHSELLPPATMSITRSNFKAIQ